MSDLRTRSAFTLKKDEAASGFLSNAREVRNVVAAHLFSLPPGHLLDAIASLQIDFKTKLDMATLTIVEQQVEREMRLLGVNNSKTFKDAAMEFELRKRNLLNSLTEELALLRKGDTILDAGVEETLAEIQLRQTILIEQEAILTEEKQALLKRKVEAERLSFDKELELVNAQLANATRRLDLIPSIRAVIAAQQRVVEAERGPMSDALALLLEAKKSLADAKLGLITPMMDKANAILAYANEQETIIPFYVSKANASLALASKTHTFAVAYSLPASVAKLAYSVSQSLALPFMAEVANNKTALAQQEILVSSKMVEKADADLQLANAELSVATKYVERANALTTYMLPAQSALADAIAKEAEYRIAASENRVKAAEKDVELAGLVAAGAVLSSNVDLATTGVALAKLTYTASEKDFEADYYYAEAHNYDLVEAAVKTSTKSRVDDIRDSSAAEVSSVKTVADEKIRAKTSTQKTLYEAKSAAITQNEKSERGKIEDIAAAQANAKITVSLVHTIST